jgi:hypothetical protein
MAVQEREFRLDGLLVAVEEARVGESLERLAAPQAERLAQQSRRRGRVLALQRRMSFGGEPTEPGGVQGPGCQLKAVTACLGGDPVAAEQLAEAGDVDLEPVPPLGCFLRPHLGQELPGGHRVPLGEGEGGQDGPGQVPADRYRPSVTCYHLKRPEDTDLHWSIFAPTAGRKGGDSGPGDPEGMTRKERQQIQIVGLAVAGDTDRATALIAEHLAEFPGDELIGFVQAWLLRPAADSGDAC